jgi:hypothetical protein
VTPSFYDQLYGQQNMANAQQAQFMNAYGVGLRPNLQDLQQLQPGGVVRMGSPLWGVDSYVTDAGTLHGEEAREAYRAERRASNKQTSIKCRGARMERKLDRRRAAITRKWQWRAKAAGVVLFGAPLAIGALGVLWRLALTAVLG